MNNELRNAFLSYIEETEKRIKYLEEQVEKLDRKCQPDVRFMRWGPKLHNTYDD